MALKSDWSNARRGRYYRYLNLVFMAVEGLVLMIDERKPDEDIQVFTPAVFDKRRRAIRRFCQKTCYGLSPGQNEHIRQLRKAALDMEECVREAREMGDPSSPQVQAYWKRHRENGRASMAGFGFSAEANRPSETLPRGPDTGRTADVGTTVYARQEINVVPDAEAPIIHTPARRKTSGSKLILE